MGTITARKRRDGSIGYTAQIRLRRDGQIIHSEAETFVRRQYAAAWLKKRETELTVPGALERLKTPTVTLATAIDRYIAESGKVIGHTKEQVLRAIKRHDLGATECSAITSADIVAFAQSLDVQPQTVGNYLSHLGAIFAIARPAWGYPLDQQAMRDAFTVARRLGLTAKSRQRERRPSLEELDRILQHFSDRSTRRPSSNPMPHIIAFALFSTRRLDEISRITWADLDEVHNRVLVRDMKNPGQKVGNNVWCDLPPEAMRIVSRMPRAADQIFPFGTDAIGASFTRAIKFLEIEDLHFHDLRHEGISRLFELGWNIPHVATVSGHRSWHSLQRYTHLRQSGDKFSGWTWLGLLAPEGSS
ncbi:tyrosine-type recombinase/integrase [Lichenihabitans psoromatis]|uniref:tyrosine-type recombinase/integrase n=1 Tax=Lichenihabitans psoromatis TaxID=2528642 RepID=UPI0010384342|nr:tyrosine-type recombinase/integrase [Lichenihabitans psoromatis]